MGREPTREEIGAALLAPPPPRIQLPVTESPVTLSGRRDASDVGKSKQGKAILNALRRSNGPMDISTVKEATKLSDYMTRKVLKELALAGLIQESWEEIGGRWE